MALTEETDVATEMTDEGMTWLMTNTWAMGEFDRLKYVFSSHDYAPIEETDSATEMSEES